MAREKRSLGSMVGALENLYEMANDKDKEVMSEIIVPSSSIYDHCYIERQPKDGPGPTQDQTGQAKEGPHGGDPQGKFPWRQQLENKRQQMMRVIGILLKLKLKSENIFHRTPHAARDPRRNH